ncbi:MAG TPA: dienelactone hydrolase family protein [Candidatus Limnocylindria bacterium]
MQVPGAVLDSETLVAQDVRIETTAGGLNAYYVRARGLEQAPSIIVIHEGFGLVEHIRDVCRRFANVGYNAIAPDLYTRIGTPDAADLPSVLATVNGIRDADVVADLEGCATFARSRPESTGRVGALGFCSGGRQSLLFACRTDALDGAVSCWGGSIRTADATHRTTESRPVPVIDLLPHLGCPLLFVRGDEDQHPSAEDAAEVRMRLISEGKVGEVREFKGAGHAFFADYRPTYREDAAFRLWPVLLDFFDRNLR